MLDAEQVRQWMEDAPEIKPDELVVQDIVLAQLAEEVYRSWHHDGRQRSIEDYLGDPEPDTAWLTELRRGFEVWAHYKIIQTLRGIIKPKPLGNLDIEMEQSAG